MPFEQCAITMPVNGGVQMCRQTYQQVAFAALTLAISPKRARRPQSVAALRSPMDLESTHEGGAQLDAHGSLPVGAPGSPERPTRWATVAVGAVLILALASRGWVAWRGYFYLDDFAFMAMAAHHSLFDLGYLLTPYNSQFMPGAHLWVWLLTRSMPFQYGGVVVVTMTLQLVLDLSFYTLLRRLFGPSPATLLPFAVFVLSPLTLPGTLWWAAALSQLPQQLAMVAVLLAHVAYLRTGRVRHGLYGVLALVAGLLFAEKTLLVIPLLGALTVLFFAVGSALNRIRMVLIDHRRVWLAYGAVVLVYGTYVVSHIPHPVRRPDQGSTVVQLGLESLVRAVVPALLGGPWTWVQIGYAGALADPGPFACGVALGLAVLVVGGTCLVNRNAWRGWTLAAGYGLVNLVVLAFSRAAVIGPIVGDEYRYVTDVTMVAALGIALSTVPIAGRWRWRQGDPLTPRPSVRQWLRSPGVHEIVAALPRPSKTAVIATTTIAFAASATWSTLAYDQFWHPNPARRWVQTATSQIATADPAVVLADAYVPGPVAWALLGSYARVGQVLSPMTRPPRILDHGFASDRLSVLDSSGHLHPAVVEGVSARQGPVRGCGWRLGADPVVIPLQRRTLPFVWTMRIGYLSSGSSTAILTVGGHRTDVSFHAGLGAAFMVVDGAVDTVAVSSLSGGATVCADSVTIGRALPEDGTRP